METSRALRICEAHLLSCLPNWTYWSSEQRSSWEVNEVDVLLSWVICTKDCVRLTSCENLIVAKQVSIFEAFFITSRFISVLTGRRLWTIFRATRNQSTPRRPGCLRSVLYYFSIYAWIFQVVVSSGFPNKTIFTFLIFFMRAACPAYLIDVVAIIIFCKKLNYSIWKLQLVDCCNCGI
jgi:hypothetical protein